MEQASDDEIAAVRPGDRNPARSADVRIRRVREESVERDPPVVSERSVELPWA
jgi:hypothetical protein